MQKKWIPILLTLGLMLTAAGCATGGQNTPSSASAPSASASQSGAASTAPAESGADKAEEGDKAPPAPHENELFGQVSATAEVSLTLDIVRGPGGGRGGDQDEDDGRGGEGDRDKDGESRQSGSDEGAAPKSPPPEGEKPADAPSGMPEDASGLPPEGGWQSPETTGESREVKMDASTSITVLGSDEALSLADIQVGELVKVTLAEDGNTALSIEILRSTGGETER